MVEMVVLEDGNCVPKEYCTFTNPITSGGTSLVDDVDMPCGADCEGDCDNCTIQKILNEYAELTNQNNEESYYYQLGYPVKVLHKGEWKDGNICNGYRFKDGIITVETKTGEKVWFGDSRKEEFLIKGNS